MGRDHRSGRGDTATSSDVASGPPVDRASGSGPTHVGGLLEARSTTRHHVVEEIGRGGMAVVHRVHDRALRRDVAMKTAGPAAGSDYLGVLTDEAQVAGQLDHPHIVPVHDVGWDPDGESVYFTMKLVRGATLTSLIDGIHGEPWDDRAIERCLQVVMRICDALAFCHSRGVVHRDVKPDNVMVGSYGQVYLMDWGLAKLVDAAPDPDAPRESGATRVTVSGGRGRTEDGEIAGTPDYMAPEQMRGEIDRIDARTDVYGVGGLLYYLLTGQGPNAGPSGAARVLIAAPVVPPTTRGAWSDLPPELCRIAMKALAPKPIDRHQSAEELRGDLEEFLRGGGWFATRAHAAGTVLVRQGDAANEAYMIMAGECDVEQEVGGVTYHLRRMGPGDVFGETAILTGAPRTATVTAATDVTLKVVTADAFERELGRHSWPGKFVRAIAERFREADARLARSRGKGTSDG